MILTSIQRLEEIIRDLHVGESNYRLWLDFLNKIHPESEILKNDLEDHEHDIRFGTDWKEYSDVREIMMLAEAHKYPTWFIQPKLNGTKLVLEYQHGELLESIVSDGIPERLEGFSGKIGGTYFSDEADNFSFIADDIDRRIGFIKKIELLTSLGFATSEFVLFPTDKIPSVSSSKLEASLHNYISKSLERGAKVDGALIISDTPLFVADGHSSHRILFKLPTLSH